MTNPGGGQFEGEASNVENQYNELKVAAQSHQTPGEASAIP